ncbi:MAG: serine/threonine-protein kinase [Actinomycetia bacterium]|nr:serine/threonine-protein kinase [Actinomycetes bacterium]
MIGTLFGPYLIEALIGRGGMGELYRAVDIRKNRTIALKVLLATLATDREFSARFRRESEIVARLQDVHIIPIHDYGEIDGRLFIDMPLIHGSDLAVLIDESPGGLAAEPAVEIVSQIAGALDTAHASSLVHRDVKPSNILIRDNHGADIAYLIDFGLARQLDDMHLTSSGALLGTLAYMAPERFDGPGDPRSDVYALACVLYQMLTMRPPFRGSDVMTYFKAHTYAPPPPLSQLMADAPPGLEEVLDRGLAKDPARRYQRAGELAAAARAASAAGQSTASGHTKIRSGRGHERRKPQLRTTLGTLTDPLTTRSAADARTPEWGASKRVAAIATTAILIASVVVAAIAVARSGHDVLRSVATIPVESAPVGIAVDPTTGRVFVANELSGLVSVIDPVSRTQTSTISVDPSPRQLALTPNGDRLYVATAVTDAVAVIDTNVDAVVATIPVGDNPVGLSISPDGKRVCVTNEFDDTVSVIDTSTRTVIATIRVLDAPINVTITPDGKRAYVTHKAADSMSVIALDDPISVTTIPIGERTGQVAFTPDGLSAWVTTPASDTVTIIDTKLMSVTRTITATDSPYAIALSPDGSRGYVAGSLSDSVSTIDAATGTVLDTDPVGDEPTKLGIGPTGLLYVTNRRSGTVSVLSTS